MYSRWLRVVSLVAVAALALALSGCGGVGSGGGPDGDDGELSLLDKWQRFKDGDPTLHMTEAEVSDAWRSAARKSTHEVILEPVNVGNDPAPDTPVETAPDFPVGTEACSPGECDIDPPPDSTWAFAPVLEHEDVPIAEFRSRYTITEVLEPERGIVVERTTLVDSRTFGGWLDYTHFKVSLTRSCTVGQPGCAETDDTDDFDPLYAGGRVSGYMFGSYSGTTPAGVGSATWTGAMAGMEDLTSVSLRRERPDVLFGDARIVIDDLAAPDVGVFFTNIHNVTEGTRRPDMSWEDLPLDDGLFGRVSRHGNGEGGGYDYLVGMFTGPGHEEVGGAFRRDGIAGAFGAKRR